MAEIRCTNCGRAHPSAAEVRRCFAETPPVAAGPGGAGAARSLFDEDVSFDDTRLMELDRFADVEVDPEGDAVPAARRSAGRPGPAARPSRPNPGRAPLARTGSGSGSGTSRRVTTSLGPAVPSTALPTTAWYRPAAEWAGPPALGRGLVVLAGAEVAPPWQEAQRIDLGPAVAADGAAQRAAMEDLARCWAQRERFVVQWHGDAPAPGEAPFATAEVDDRTPWQVGVDFEFTVERVEGLLRQHAVDDRAVAGARFLPAESAMALGASACHDPLGDVCSAQGEPIVIDGGPLSPMAVPGAAVVPAAFIDAGRLTPMVDGRTEADLAEDQLAAVAHRSGGARIIAPAGSGKTRVLTERARLLLAGRKIPPSMLTLVAFNVRAAEEMRSRTTDLPQLHIRTLNSLGLAIVNGGGPFLARPDGRRLTTIDETEVRRILERLVRFPRRAGTDPAAPWLEALSAARLGLRDPRLVEDDFGGDVDGFADVLPQYRAELARRGAVDYDEQIAGAIERLLSDPAARRRAQAACRVLLVDEFQDLAPAHLLLIRLLSAPAYDCFGVGDDDQTIYGYVGASPDWLVSFERWFPGAANHPLQINYRCPPAVVDAASNLLTRNRQRVAKEIHPAPGRAAGATDLVVERVSDVSGATCEAVEALVAEGVAPADIAVLTRVNVTLLPVQLRLAAAGIATTAPVDAQLLSRSGVRAALAWLALAASGRDSTGALRSGWVSDAARRPPRGLSPKLVEWMDEQRNVEGLRRLASRLTSPKDADKVEAFAADVELLAALVRNGADTATVLRAVAEQLGLGAAMDTLDRSRGAVDRSAHGDDLAALEAVAHLHPDPSGFGAWLRQQLTDTGRASSVEGVQLATVHRVKGREWPYVVVHDVSSGLLPHRLATDLEEERRVFHVGLTRSSRRTIVVSDASRPSPFLDELAVPGEPPPVTAVPVGGRGAGLVTSGGAARRPGRAGASGDGAGDGSPSHQPTVDGLKAWRKDRARRDGVPAYVVLPDKSIEDIARRRPSSLVELSRCHGIGPAKLERYGDEVLAVVDTYR